MTSNLRPKADRRKRTTTDTGAIGVASSTAPDRAEIARKAYELYCARGGQNGSEVDDWLQAERELQASAPLLTEAASQRRRSVRKTAALG